MKAKLALTFLATRLTLWPLAFAHSAWAEAPHLHEAGDADDPVAQITAPASSEQISVATISSPTDVVGTASDAHLASWQLLISPSGQNQWSELAQGSSSVTDAKLGHIQSQTIANGLYDIGLIATDTSGKQTSARITVAIEGAQKTAPLQLSFEDLSLDVEGLPLTVTRTYDSLKRHQSLDFGHTAGASTTRTSKSRPMASSGGTGASSKWAAASTAAGPWPMARGAWHGLTTMAGF